MRAVWLGGVRCCASLQVCFRIVRNYRQSSMTPFCGKGIEFHKLRYRCRFEMRGPCYSLSLHRCCTNRATLFRCVCILSFWRTN